MHDAYIKTALVRFWRPYSSAWLEILPISKLTLKRDPQSILALQNHVLHRVRVQDGFLTISPKLITKTSALKYAKFGVFFDHVY